MNREYIINIYNYRDMLKQASVVVINIKEHNTIYLVYTCKIQ